MSTSIVIRCTGRRVDDHGQPVGDECGQVYPRRVDGPYGPPVGDTTHQMQARAAGWAIGRLPDGTTTATCPACRRPDPATAATCRALTKGEPPVITIPAVEFTGLIGDVLSFALDDTDFPDLNCVRMAWDGELLHAQAHDGQHLAWSRWSADDDPDTDAQESLTDPWGGDDDPWAAVISHAHAKELASNYKVVKKLWWTPLSVGQVDGNLRVVRNRLPGLMAITTTVDGQEVTFPDFDEVLTNHSAAESVRNLAFTAGHLAHFADVRPRGPLELTFTGNRGPALVRIGDRFTGAITPVRPAADRHLQAAA